MAGAALANQFEEVGAERKWEVVGLLVSSALRGKTVAEFVMLVAGLTRLEECIGFLEEKRSAEQEIVVAPHKERSRLNSKVLWIFAPMIQKQASGTSAVAAEISANAKH
jgi:hypothetical protein